MLYRLLLVLASLNAATVAFFFLWGLSDGAVTARNMLLWLALIGVVGGIYVAALRLRATGSSAAATVLMSLLAVPAVLFALFMIVITVAQPRWN